MSGPENDAQAFFIALRKGFNDTISAGRDDPRLIDALTAQAMDLFERNAEIQSEGQPAPACCRGCDTCCCLQVSATAPEIFLAARFMRLTKSAFAAHGVDLGGRVSTCSAQTKGMDQQTRFASRQMCPFIIGGACAIYSVRTLACRGHVAFDRGACEAAAKGLDVEAPVSSAHKSVRALVQGALQAALRDSGLEWGASEFLAGLERALNDPDAEARWLRGERVFEDLAIDADEGRQLAEFCDGLSGGRPNSGR
jgi:Fe-S-cluster containining protein